MAGFEHQPVLLNESIEFLKIRPDGIYIDATIGGAGHASRIAGILSSQGTLIGIDQDATAIQSARERLAGVSPHIQIIKRNFTELDEVLNELGIACVDGILFDLGVSSPQLDLDERGFSYQADAPLDMRMDQAQPFSAYHLVNSADPAELTRILWDYGEERWAKRIVRAIEERRKESPIETTAELASIIKNAIPAPARRSGPHPARRSFQAIRIAVNRELEVLETALDKAIQHLNPGGRLVVITFHSLEDRIVKRKFIEWSGRCRCPRNLPVCQCGCKAIARILTPKPIIAKSGELDTNRRARSAKLRSVEKLEEV
jgi:16S rRNA (cytosine1402-N4)-methyltransferase